VKNASITSFNPESVDSVKMCHETKCPNCGKSSWSGCGQHVESVFRSIPVERRCFCGYKDDELKALMDKAKEDPSYKGPYPKGGGGGCVIA
jgi:hypothetical protein